MSLYSVFWCSFICQAHNESKQSACGYEHALQIQLALLFGSQSADAPAYAVSSDLLQVQTEEVNAPH